MPENQPEAKGPGGLGKRTWLIGGIVVGLGIYLWYRNKQNAANAAAQNVGGVPTSLMPSGAMSNTTSPPPPLFNSLQDWEQQVQKWATGTPNNFDAATTQNALQAYQQGTCLTVDQFNIIDKALAFFGQPPNAPFQGLVQCQNQPTPPPPPPPPPSTNTNAQDMAIYQILTQEVGQLSAMTGIGATPAQVATFPNDPLGSEAANVGVITNHLQGPGRPTGIPQLLPAAYLLAGSKSAFDSASPFLQNVYLEMANVQAYERGYSAGTIKKVG